MQDKNSITPAQLVLLVVGSRIMVAYTYLPIMNIPPGNQDVWLVCLVAALYSVIICIPVLFLSNKFRGILFQKHCDAVLGKIFGRVLTAMYSGHFVFMNFVFVLLAIIFINSSVFPETPPWAIAIYIFVPVIYASLKGAQTIARLAFFIAPYIIVTIVLFFILSFNKMDFQILKPVLADSSFKDINIGAFLTACLFSDVFIFPIFSVHFEKKISINISFAYSLLLFTVLFILIVIPTITVIGLDFAQRAWNPYYFFTRQVVAYDFIQRVESLNILGWFMAILMRLSLYNYMTCYLLSGIFKTKSHKVFVVPVFALVCIVALLPWVDKSSVLAMLKSQNVLPMISLSVIAVPPLIKTIVYFLRRQKVDEQLGLADKSAAQ